MMVLLQYFSLTCFNLVVHLGPKSRGPKSKGEACEKTWVHRLLVRVAYRYLLTIPPSGSGPFFTPSETFSGTDWKPFCNQRIGFIILSVVRY